MGRTFLLCLLFLSVAAAESFPSLFWSYRGELVREGEATGGESAALTSFYHRLEADYDLGEELFLSLGGTANVVLEEEEFSSEAYRKGRWGKEELDRAMVHQAAVTWDDGFTALSLGRQQVVK